MAAANGTCCGSVSRSRLRAGAVRPNWRRDAERQRLRPSVMLTFVPRRTERPAAGACLVTTRFFARRSALGTFTVPSAQPAFTRRLRAATRVSPASRGILQWGVVTVGGGAVVPDGGAVVVVAGSGDGEGAGVGVSTGGAGRFSGSGSSASASPSCRHQRRMRRQRRRRRPLGLGEVRDQRAVVRAAEHGPARWSCGGVPARGSRWGPTRWSCGPGSVSSCDARCGWAGSSRSSLPGADRV